MPTDFIKVEFKQHERATRSFLLHSRKIKIVFRTLLNIYPEKYEVNYKLIIYKKIRYYTRRRHRCFGCMQILMALDLIFKKLLDHENINSFLKRNHIYINPETTSMMGFHCRNENCRNPVRGFKQTKIRRNLSEKTAIF